MRIFFATDLHGRTTRYRALFDAVRDRPPDAICLGGDLLPRAGAAESVERELRAGFAGLREALGGRYPRVLLIPGNDDPRVLEPEFLRGQDDGLWEWICGRVVTVGRHRVFGYPYVPPTPFALKDWERYDVGHFVDPGCESPEEGVRSVEVPAEEARYATIQGDLDRLVGDDDVRDAVFLFHTPPYDSCLDRAALDGKTFDHVPLDLHVGSIAVRRFIEARQPLLTLHGHVHESARLTGRWTERIGRTVIVGGAHDGPELALVRIDTEEPERAVRELV